MTRGSDDDRPVEQRAAELLGREIHGHGVTVVLTEVEAYGGVLDPASHAYTRTPRSEIMYGEPWRLYVYRSYGIHWCANVVTGPSEEAAAVLLRAGRVTGGLTRARERRGPVPDVALGRGPGNLARVLGITAADLGTDVLDPDAPVRLGALPDVAPTIRCGPRVGVSKAADVPWRFWIEGEPSVSAYRRSARAGSPSSSDASS